MSGNASCPKNAGDILVSVVIPCYNQGGYLDEAITSVLHSTLASVEIVVVNDGSTDKFTQEILSKQGWPRTRIIHQENKGLAAARNTGIANARGAYILPLDSDDRIDPIFLELAVWLLLNNKNLGVVYCYAQLFGDESGVWITGDFIPGRLTLENFIPAASVFPKHVWEAVGGYDDSPALRAGFEDWDFWIRLAGRGYDGRCIHSPLFLYRKHAGSMLPNSRLKSKELTGYINSKNKSIIKRLKNKNRVGKSLVHRVKSYYHRSIRPLLPPALNRKAKGIYYNLITQAVAGSLAESLRPKVTASSMGLYEVTNMRGEFTVPERIFLDINGGTDNRIKVMFILPWLQHGGTESVFLNLMAGLDPSQYKKLMITTLKSENEWEHLFRPLCEEIIHLPAFLSEPREITGFFVHYINSRKIDIIHISNSQIGYLLTDAVKEAFPEIKIMDTLHMEEPYEPWDYFRFSDPFKNNLSKRIVVSKHLKQTLVELYSEPPEKVHVIYNGIDLTRFQAKTAAPARPPVIGFIGRFVEQKQPLKALEIFSRLRKQLPNIRMVMYGDGPLKQKAEKEARRLGLNGCVTFPGWLENVPDTFQREIDIFLQPSLREGLPVIGIEAMASGLPVVASRVKGWDEVVQDGETGFLCETVEDFVRSLSGLAQSRAMRKDMGLNAQKRAEALFDEIIMVGHYKKLYAELKQDS